MRPNSVASALCATPLVVLTACAAAPLSPEANRVAVYEAPLERPAASRLPPGCEEIRRTAAQQWSELDRTGSKDPYREERAATAAAGGNVLLVLGRQISPRATFDCPASSPISDCPPAVGAWFDVVFVSYACSAQSLAELPKERSP